LLSEHFSASQHTVQKNGFSASSQSLTFRHRFDGEEILKVAPRFAEMVTYDRAGVGTKGNRVRFLSLAILGHKKNY
jgi:hypothetical protein